MVAEVSTPDGAATLRPMHRINVPMSADPAGVISAYAAAWQRGDPAAAWEFYADDVVMRLPGRGSLAGEHHGRDAVIAAIRQLLSRTSESTAQVEPLDQLVSDDQVAVVLAETVVRGDQRLRLERVNLYRVRDGRIARIDIYEANQYEVDNFFD